MSLPRISCGILLNVFVKFIKIFSVPPHNAALFLLRGWFLKAVKRKLVTLAARPAAQIRLRDLFSHDTLMLGGWRSDCTSIILGTSCQ